jgi:hypothetical protein
MAARRNGTLKKDFRIFQDPGFLISLVLIGILAGMGAYILVHASNQYGVPVSPYWK